MDCGKKINSLFKEIEGVIDTQRNLKEIKQLLFTLKVWQNWLKKIYGFYKFNQLL
jgi:hypothetical protein